MCEEPPFDFLDHVYLCLINSPTRMVSAEFLHSFTAWQFPHYRWSEKDTFQWRELLRKTPMLKEATLDDAIDERDTLYFLANKVNFPNKMMSKRVDR